MTGEHRCRPPVKPARRFDRLHAGPKVQVVGVAKDEIDADLQERIRVERLDASGRPHGTEGRSWDIAVRCMDQSSARPSIVFFYFKRERHLEYPKSEYRNPIRRR